MGGATFLAISGRPLDVFLSKKRPVALAARVARFFSVKLTKTGGNIPNNQQIYQMAIDHTRYP
jgi:hypothetical protein